MIFLQRDELKASLSEAEKTIAELESYNLKISERESEAKQEVLSAHSELTTLKQQVPMLQGKLTKGKNSRINFHLITGVIQDKFMP